MVSAQGHQKERRAQKGRFSTACETAHMKSKADVKNKKEYEKWMEESSRSAEQHAGKNDWTTYSVKECWVSQV